MPHDAPAEQRDGSHDDGGAGALGGERLTGALGGERLMFIFRARRCRRKADEETDL